MRDTDLSRVGIEFNALHNAGLLVRPPFSPSLEINTDSEVVAITEGEPPALSASAKLIAALSAPSSDEPMQEEENEPTEARAPRKAISPTDPSEAEVEAHKLSGHACFRSWCRHCIRGKGCEGHHSRTAQPDSAIPITSWDYCYLSSSRDPDRQTSRTDAAPKGDDP